MPKRGRPLSTNTEDPIILQRRQQTAERVRRFREIRRAASAQQQTQHQSEQAEAVAEHPFEDREAAQTLPGLGLRVQNVVIAQDTYDAQLQRHSIQVDEHDTLYRETKPTLPLLPTDATSICLEQQPNLAQFFQTLPPRNPFTAAPPPITDGTANISAINIPNKDNNGEETGEDNGAEESDPAFGLIDEQIWSQQIVDEETSIYHFASEHLDHTSDTESDVTEIPAHDHTVQKLYEQLQDGFHGCSQEQHKKQLQEHLEHAGDNHYSLSDIFNDRSFPSVLGLPELISAERLARQQFPTPSQWQAVFCGIPPQQQGQNCHPMNVCLHKEETQTVEPQVAYDIDSFLGFASSLSMARQGIWYQPAPQMRQNMATDVHLETNVFQDNANPEQPSRSHLAMLRDVPHFLLGRVVGAHDITVHILFPHLSLT